MSEPRRDKGPQVWTLASAAAGSDALDALLKGGWEPFGVVAVGQTARVHLTPYSARSMAPLDGKLALPPRAKLRPWHVTLVNFSGATLCVRGSKKGRVRIDGSDIDQTVLRDGDSIDLGHVRIVYRCR